MKKRINILITVMLGLSVIVMKIVMDKKIVKRDNMLDKIHELYVAFNRWLQIRQEDKSLIEYFQQRGYKTVAIYGMKELGERLYDELKGSDIEVAYIIDKNADTICADVDVVTPDEELASVDAIVVTAIYYFDEIKERLSKKTKCPVISLEDILYEV